jgi:hypothetical protein
MLSAPLIESREISGIVISASGSSAGVPLTVATRGSRCAWLTRRLPVLDAPTGQADSEGAFVGQDLVRPLVARPHRDEQATRLVRLVDRQRVVRNQVGERVGDAVEQRVEALLAEDVVEHVRQAPVRLDERVV